MDITNRVGPFTGVTMGRIALTTVDSSGWEIISNDTSYTAMALLSDIRFDLGSIHNRVVLSKLLIQDRTQPVLDTIADHLIGYEGMLLDGASAGDVSMHREKRKMPSDTASTALGYKYTAVNINGTGPDAALVYPGGGLFNWTVQLPDGTPYTIGGIPPESIHILRPSTDTVEVIDRGLTPEYTVEWEGPNSLVDLVVSDYSITGISPTLHTFFQGARSNSATIDLRLLPNTGLTLFTFSVATKVTSDIRGIPVIMRFTTIHNVLVRIKG